MTERITSQMMANLSLESIDTDLDQLSTTEEELSSGYTINSASDNPYGAAESLSLNTQISADEDYSDNITEATSVTDAESSALSSIETIITDVQDLTEEAANGDTSSSDLADDASTVLGYISEIKSLADTQYDGSYIFSGTDTEIEPYDASSDSDTDTYEGNSDSLSYLVGPSTTLSISADLYSVLGSGTGSAGSFDSSTGEGGLLSTLRQIYTDMDDDDTSGLGDDLTSLSDNLDDLESLQSSIGTVQDSLSSASTFITDVETDTKENLASVEDVDEASAEVNYEDEETAYEAALKATADIVQLSLLTYLDSDS